MVISMSKKMSNQLSFKSSISNSIFKKFLLKLEPKTLEGFTKFGEITPKNVNSIIRKEINNSNNIKFFSFVDNELISYSFLTKFEKSSKKHNCILGIVMADSWQKKGFGKKICKKMISTAWKNNFEKVWLTVYHDNISAYRLYNGLGFEVEGIFLNDEKFYGKYKHKISMAIFKKNQRKNNNRNEIIKKIS